MEDLTKREFEEILLADPKDWEEDPEPVKEPAKNPPLERDPGRM